MTRNYIHITKQLILAQTHHYWINQHNYSLVVTTKFNNTVITIEYSNIDITNV